MSPEMPAKYGRRILASQSAAAQVCAAFEEAATVTLEKPMIPGEEDAEPGPVNELVREFLQANKDELAADPILAGQQLDRFLEKLAGLPEADRRMIRETVLGSLS
jgi:hypothetical protein